MSKKGKLLIVSGSAGSGKSTALKKFREGLCDPFRFSISATTRPPRDGELNGREYYFVSCEEFLRMRENGELLESAFFNNNYYGTPKSEVIRLMDEGYTVILEIEIDGASQIMKSFDEFISVFISPPDYKTLEARLRGRGNNSENDIKERLERAKDEIEFAREYQHILVNYDGRIDDVTQGIIDICAGKSNIDIEVTNVNNFIENFYN